MKNRLLFFLSTTMYSIIIFAYQGLSPYNYCNENPVVMVDPDGEAPIYAKKRGHVVTIGDDGKDVDRSYLVRRSVKRDVMKATKENKPYDGDLQQSKNVMYIPMNKIADGVAETERLTLESGTSSDDRVEFGGHALKGDVEPRIWDPGQRMAFNIVEGQDQDKIQYSWSITPFKINGKINVGSRYESDIEYIWHIHPGYAVPSISDYKMARGRRNNGYKGNFFIVGLTDQNVVFYNEKKFIKISLSDFIRMTKQEIIEE